MIGPEHLLMMSIELDHAPDVVWEAIDRLADERLLTLIDLLRSAPQASWVAADAWQRAITPARLRALADADPPDLKALETVLDVIGPEDAGVLLDLLAESDSLATRKRLFTRLVELAPRIGTEIVRRTRDERWFARRNMLLLLGELSVWPRKWSPAEFAADPHPAVRREAFKLMLRLPEHRDRALCGLLEDTDRRALALGLAAATESCPPEAVDLLAAIVRDGTISQELQVMGIRALGLSGDPRAVEPLLEQVRRGPGLGRTKLADKSPQMLAALQALAVFPGGAPRATRLLARAARSGDPDVRAAAGVSS